MQRERPDSRGPISGRMENSHIGPQSDGAVGHGDDICKHGTVLTTASEPQFCPPPSPFCLERARSDNNDTGKSGPLHAAQKPSRPHKDRDRRNPSKTGILPSPPTSQEAKKKGQTNSTINRSASSVRAHHMLHAEWCINLSLPFPRRTRRPPDSTRLKRQVCKAHRLQPYPRLDFPLRKDGMD
ncbi:hypothetical protein T440DRAFT_471372 [Plenodomus tracheiphilus IPT5]|uniref:Uncharacterized protein n=1 Tax=Plenodomus tracheiphilus IPT5 TaxID=1408161 RepID=A0A6A7AXE9_9PLEO|nr:hypothetical protein T440DRAFT_471372 [Plenodomus tracheiphilus IPT5]